MHTVYGYFQFVSQDLCFAYVAFLTELALNPDIFLVRVEQYVASLEHVQYCMNIAVIRQAIGVSDQLVVTWTVDVAYLRI